MEDAAATPTELSFDEALALGIQMLQSGSARRRRAPVSYAQRHRARTIPNVLHFSGVLAHQQGRSDEGIALIQRSLEIQSDQPDWLQQPGNHLQRAAQRFDDAIAAYQRAIALNPTHANAYNNLGVLLRGTGKPVEAEAAYRKAIDIEPQFIDAYHNLGVLLASVEPHQGSGDLLLQGHHACSTASRNAPHAGLWPTACLVSVDKAIELYEEWLKDDPDNPVISHLLAGCTGRDVPAQRRRTPACRSSSTALPPASNRSWRTCSIARQSLVHTMLEDVRPAAREDAGRARCRVRHGLVRSAGCAVRAAI